MFPEQEYSKPTAELILAIWRSIARRFQAIIWIVLLAYCALAIFPPHLHFSHPDEVGSSTHSHSSAPITPHEIDYHDHAVDFHIHAIPADTSDHPQDHVFKASPDVLDRKLNEKTEPLLLAVLLTFFLVVMVCGMVPVPGRDRPLLVRLPFQLKPPLRAPPAF